MNELLILISCIIHVAVHLRWKKIRYKIFYYESAILLVSGLLSWIILVSIGKLLDTHGVFTLLTSRLFPIQPIDLIFTGLGLLLSTLLLDFLTKQYGLNRESLLAILPWTLTAQYRFLHEFVWVYHYWISMNAIEGKFSDQILWLDKETMMFPALLTHTYAIFLIIFSIFNFIVILHDGRKINE